LVLLDTNIFVYATGKSHEYKEPCGRIIEAIGVGRGDCNVDTEICQEVLYLYDLRGQRDVGLTTVQKMLTLFPNPLSIGKEEIAQATVLMQKYPKFIARDAIHAAVVINNRLDAIVSTDRVFDETVEVKRFDPIDFLKSIFQARSSARR